MQDLLIKAEEVESCTNLEVMWTHFEQTLAGLGFDHFIYLYASSPSQILYAQANIEVHQDPNNPYDPFLDYCCNNYAVTKTGIAYVQDYPYLPPHAVKLIEQAAEKGFRSGFGIPMRLKNAPTFGGFNLGTPLDRTAFDSKYLPHLEALRAFCLVTHRRFEELAGHSLYEQGKKKAAVPASLILEQLSKREREVLAQLAQGATRPQTANNLGISEHTVGTHIKNIYAKLEVNSNIEAVTLYLQSARA